MGLLELSGVTVERGGRTLITDVDMALAPGRMTVLPMAPANRPLSKSPPVCGARPRVRRRSTAAMSPD